MKAASPPPPSEVSGTRPIPGGRWMQAGLSVLAGLLAALVIHYVLYRVGLPSKPFIYVAF